jgi:hypothetical protein
MFQATYDALQKTYKYSTPDLWTPVPLPKTLYEEHTEFLASTAKKVFA